MPDYRKTSFQRRLAANAAKSIVTAGIAAWLIAALGMAQPPDLAAPRETIRLDAGGTSSALWQGPPELTGPPPPEAAVAGPPAPPPRDPTVACGSFLEPAQGTLTSKFGARWGRNHNGIDIGGTQGSEILAADAGKIILAGWVDGYGNYLVIDHENGYQTAYGHCSQLLVTEGSRVAQGQVIAYMGSTGNSTGPHLHFEVKVNGSYQDPLNYVLYH